MIEHVVKKLLQPHESDSTGLRELYFFVRLCPLLLLMLKGKIYPNGRFAIWRDKKYEERRFESEVETRNRYDQDYLRHLREENERECVREQGGAAYQAHQKVLVLLGLGEEGSEGNENGSLGSSKLSKSNTPRADRGSRGISVQQRRLLANGAFLMEKWVERKDLGMITFTFPAMSKDEWSDIAENWSAGLNRMRQMMRRLLKSKRLPIHFLGCVEIQSKRLESRREPGLHLHLLLQVRQEGASTFHSSVSDYLDIWRRCWSPVVDVSRFPPQCVDLSVVKKSAGAYIGKYLSKGVGDVEKLVEVTGGWHPASWAFCSKELRDQIEFNTSYGTEIGEFLRDAIKDNPEMFQFVGQVRLPSEVEGHPGAIVATYGQSEIVSFIKREV